MGQTFATAIRKLRGSGVSIRCYYTPAAVVLCPCASLPQSVGVLCVLCTSKKYVLSRSSEFGDFAASSVVTGGYATKPLFGRSIDILLRE